MITEEATVVSIEKNTIEIEINRSKPCGLCGKTQGCGNVIWGKIFSHKKKNLIFSNDIQANIGDRVSLSIEEGYLLKTSLLLYGLPLFFMFFSMIVFSLFTDNLKDLYAFFGAVLGLAVGVTSLKIFNSYKHDSFYKEATLSKI